MSISTRGLEDLQALAEHLGTTPTVAQCHAHGLDVDMLRLDFGSFSDALDAAGLPSRNELKSLDASPPIALDKIRALTEHLGHTPTRREALQFGVSFKALEKLGGFTQACIKAGVPPRLPGRAPRGLSPREALLHRIRHVYTLCGYRCGERQLEQAGVPADIIRFYFPTTDAALDAALQESAA